MHSNGETWTPTVICAIEETTADSVVSAGGELAEALGAPVVVFAHIRRDPPLFNSRADHERARHTSRRQGHAILRRARRSLTSGVEVEERVEFGPVVDALTAIADETAGALIVAGSRRRGTIAAAVLGSVSRTLGRVAPCPVLIAAEPAPGASRRLGPAGSHSTVIAGVDGSERSVKVTALAGKIADRLGDRLLLVHAHEATGTPPVVIGPAGKEISTPTALTEVLARAGDSASLIVENGRPASVLQRVCARQEARLIVIGAGRNDGMRSLLADSVAQQLPGLAPCPVLILPEAHLAARAAPIAA
jgi:nucleotide-binding universal stress UspA family protein